MCPTMLRKSKSINRGRIKVIMVDNCVEKPKSRMGIEMYLKEVSEGKV